MTEWGIIGRTRRRELRDYAKLFDGVRSWPISIKAENELNSIVCNSPYTRISKLNCRKFIQIINLRQ